MEAALNICYLFGSIGPGNKIDGLFPAELCWLLNPPSYLHLFSQKKPSQPIDPSKHQLHQWLLGSIWMCCVLAEVVLRYSAGIFYCELWNVVRWSCKHWNAGTWRGQFSQTKSLGLTPTGRTSWGFVGRESFHQCRLLCNKVLTCFYILITCPCRRRCCCCCWRLVVCCLFAVCCLCLSEAHLHIFFDWWWRRSQLMTMMLLLMMKMNEDDEEDVIVFVCWWWCCWWCWCWCWR